MNKSKWSISNLIPEKIGKVRILEKFSEHKNWPEKRNFDPTHFSKNDQKCYENFEKFEFFWELSLEWTYEQIQIKIDKIFVKCGAE